jgi:Fe-S oxidoreductase
MDRLSDFTYTMESCNHCGQCKWILGPKMRGWKYAEICPIHQRWHYDAYSGQGLINIAEEVLNGELAYADGLIEHIYRCTTCGACDVNCKSIRDMEVLETILALRAKCVEEGEGPMAPHKEYARHVEEEHNIYGKPHNRRFDWLPGGDPSTEGAGMAYFVGCNGSYRHPEIARDTVSILSAAGLRFTLLGAGEYCCGAPLWRTGQIKEAEKQARHILGALNKLGIKTVVTSCAECYGAFRGFYPRIAPLGFEVRHISELVRDLLNEGRLKIARRLDVKATYHDPCLLGRLSEVYVPWNGKIGAYGRHDPPKEWRRGTYGVYDAPRMVLQEILGPRLAEMTRNEENSFCCGAGGGVADAFPDFALWTASERLDEAESTGAEAIVSCCPFCGSSFENAIGAGQRQMRYYDLTRLVKESMDGTKGGKE